MKWRTYHGKSRENEAMAYLEPAGNRPIAQSSIINEREAKSKAGLCETNESEKEEGRRRRNAASGGGQW